MKRYSEGEHADLVLTGALVCWTGPNVCGQGLGGVRVVRRGGELLEVSDGGGQAIPLPSSVSSVPLDTVIKGYET